MTRQTGVHAAGVVIADRPLVEHAPLYRDGPEGGPVVQYEMKAAEGVGLIKFDFLGLKTLDQIRDAANMIERNTGERPDVDTLPVDDEATFALLQRGDGLGVFQVESSGMRELLTRLRPSNIDDLIALLALYRPGPLSSGMVDTFIDCKHGRKAVEYPHPSLESILESTYGSIVYQEQVMQIAQTLSGYSLGEADLLRRAMGKKKKEEMDKQKVRFVEGAIRNDIDEKLADDIFELLAYFAGYGFNKSHSAAYGMISYQTAWLKAHHRAEYMAALMSIERNNTDKVLLYIGDCKRAGLEVLPPDVNASQASFDVPADARNQIRFGLAAVKGWVPGLSRPSSRPVTMPEDNSRTSRTASSAWTSAASTRRSWRASSSAAPSTGQTAVAINSSSASTKRSPWPRRFRATRRPLRPRSLVARWPHRSARRSATRMSVSGRRRSSWGTRRTPSGSSLLGIPSRHSLT